MTELEKAKLGAKRSMWLAHFSMAVAIGCLIAGIWHDWRWLPTALFPLANFFFWAAVRTEIERQIKATEHQS